MTGLLQESACRHDAPRIHTAFIGLGSNQGDRRGQIDAAVRLLRAAEGIHEVVVSPLHETTPVGGPAGQGPYLNAAARIQTPFDPHGLLTLLMDIEQRLGRVRGARWGPRTIDLDLLLFEDRIIDTPDLIVPHPRMHERSFVLEPLAEIAPDVRHPRLGLTIEQMLQRLRAGLSPS